MSGSVTSTPITSSLNTLSNTPATTQVGANANNPQMNQFLTLLVAQLQNQDPMSPTDPTQFVAQLAQFSTVEQLVQGNATLSTMSSNISSLALGQYSGLINHTVTATTTSVALPGSGATNLQFNVTTPNLSNLNVTVTNSSGTVVQTIPVSGTAGTVTLNGNDSSGNPLPSGQYTIALNGTSTAAGSVGQTQSAGTLSSSGTVSSVQQSSSGTWQLQLTNGGVVAATSVTSVQ
jgi:flagellar basal-body rod modification protein FlgD